MIGQVFVGYDPREDLACRVAASSLLRRASAAVSVQFLALAPLLERGFYSRPLERRDAQIWDPISAAPMTTEHAIARFFLPWLAPEAGPRWALFVDGDVLFRGDVQELFALRDPRYALQCVQRRQEPAEAVKKGGQAQTSYPRKNWSSVMLWNLDHPAHRRLSLADVNHRVGRDLHRFCWLEDAEIGALPARWNHLVGVDERDADARLAHFTLGLPDVRGYEYCEFSDEWREERALLRAEAVPA
jgi:hypothetical protein